MLRQKTGPATIAGNSTSASSPSSSCSLTRCSAEPVPAASATLSPKGCHVPSARPARKSRKLASNNGCPSISCASPPSGRWTVRGARSRYFSGTRCTHRSGGTSRCPSLDIRLYCCAIPTSVRKGNRSRLTAAPVPGLKQLQGEHRGMSGNGDEFKQSLGGLDLAVLEAQSLFFEQPKQLFDNPSRPVPADDLPSGIGIGGRMGGEQPPGNRLGPRWWVGLAQFDQAQPDLRRQPRRTGIARPGDRDDPKAQLQPSLALGPP